MAVLGAAAAAMRPLEVRPVPAFARVEIDAEAVAAEEDEAGAHAEPR